MSSSLLVGHSNLINYKIHETMLRHTIETLELNIRFDLCGCSPENNRRALDLAKRSQVLLKGYILVKASEYKFLDHLLACELRMEQCTNNQQKLKANLAGLWLRVPGMDLTQQSTLSQAITKEFGALVDEHISLANDLVALPEDATAIRQAKKDLLSAAKRIVDDLPNVNHTESVRIFLKDVILFCVNNNE